jgi:hypothetical protein
MKKSLAVLQKKHLSHTIYYQPITAPRPSFGRHPDAGIESRKNNITS